MLLKRLNLTPKSYLFQLEPLQYIHSHGYIHGDIQPQNILTGVDDPLTIFLVDFGLSNLKRYRQLATIEHLPIRRKRGLNGTPAFASINSHLGGELGRRGGLESLVYVLVYLLSGSLPWLLASRRRTALSAVLKCKQTTAIEQLCNQHGFPQLSRILLYSHMVSFSETPDYDYLRSLLRAAFTRPPDESQSTMRTRFFVEQDLRADTQEEVLPSRHTVFTPRIRPRACIPQ